jgi:hypothetical protein
LISRLFIISFFVLLTIFFTSCEIPEVSDVEPPLVSLLYPYTGSVISGLTQVSVQATDNREVKEIWYNLDGIRMEKHEGSSRVFELDATQFADEREHTIQASARDGDGNTGVSFQVLVVISATGDITPPLVQITHPQNAQEVADSTTVVADAVDDFIVSEVAFFVNGDSSHSDYIYPYEFVWSLQDLEWFTQYSVIAKAFDGARNSSNSSPVTITVVPGLDQTPPVAVLLYPLPGQTLFDIVEVQVDASDDRALDRVEFYIDGEFKESADAISSPPPYNYSWDTTPLEENSQHSLYVKAIDEAGNQSTNGATLFTIGRTPDTEPPTLVLLYPVPGDPLTATVNVAVDVADNVGVQRVEYYVDGGIAGAPNFIAISPPWNYSWDTTPWADGLVHTLYIKAFDTSDNPISVGPVSYIIM